MRLRPAAIAWGLYYRRTTTAKWYKAAERSLYAMSSLKEQLGSGEKRKISVSYRIKPGTAFGTSLELKNVIKYQDQTGNSY